VVHGVVSSFCGFLCAAVVDRTGCKAPAEVLARVEGVLLCLIVTVLMDLHPWRYLRTYFDVHVEQIPKRLSGAAFSSARPHQTHFATLGN
jgi:hypothetical protein